MRCRQCGSEDVTSTPVKAYVPLPHGVVLLEHRCASCGCDMLDPTPTEVIAAAAAPPDQRWRFVFSDGRSAIGVVDAIQLVEVWALVRAAGDQIEWSEPDPVKRTAFVCALMLGASIDLYAKTHDVADVDALRAALTHLEPYYPLVSGLVHTLANGGGVPS